MKSICIYCGSSPGASPLYAQAARRLAKEMVADNIGLVYGGASVGLMGIIADEVLRLGGEATGVIPKALLDREVGHQGLTRLHIVKDMHERKALMAELSDESTRARAALGRLPEKQRLSIQLRVDEGLSFREIGEVIGSSEGAARVNYFHGIRKLREWME